MTLPVQTMAITVPIPIPTGRPASMRPIAREMTMAEKSKRFFSETHVLSAALAENSCQAVGRVWDDVDVYGHSGADSRKNDGKDKNEKPHSHLVRCRENPVEDGDKGARQVTCGNLQKLERREFSFQQYDL
mgnify:CR=1 FL=1